MERTGTSRSCPSGMEARPWYEIPERGHHPSSGYRRCDDARMPRLQRKALSTPDIVRAFPHGQVDIVNLVSRIAWDRAGLGTPPTEREVEIAGRVGNLAVVSTRSLVEAVV